MALLAVLGEDAIFRASVALEEFIAEVSGRGSMALFFRQGVYSAFTCCKMVAPHISGV
jgi:hypothetical protein